MQILTHHAKSAYFTRMELPDGSPVVTFCVEREHDILKIVCFMKGDVPKTEMLDDLLVGGRRSLTEVSLHDATSIRVTKSYPQNCNSITLAFDASLELVIFGLPAEVTDQLVADLGDEGTDIVSKKDAAKISEIVAATT